MNQVFVEGRTLEWVEQEMLMEEPNNSQANMEDEMEMTNVISHYVLHGEEHIHIYQTVSVNSKARDMNATSTRPLIQCYKCNGPHKANECPYRSQLG